MSRKRSDARRRPAAPAAESPSRPLAWLTIGALAACALAGILFACCDIFDTDFGRHIAFGRLLLNDFDAVRSITMGQGVEILQQAYSYWLYEVLLTLVFDHAGPAGIVCLRAAVLVAAFLLALLLARRMGARGWTCGVALALALLVSHERFLDRPEIFSFLAWAGALWILIRRRAERAAWLLVPLQIVWANTHLWFGLLPLLFGAFALGDFIEKKGDLRRSAILLGALVAAACVSPAGPGAWQSQLYLARFLGRNYSLPFQIGEMMSPFSGYGANLTTWSFRIVLPLVLIAVLAARRRLGWGPVFALLLATALSARARRAIPLFGITAAVFLPIALTDLSQRLPVSIRRRLTLVLTSAALLCGLAGAWGLLTGRIFLARGEDRRIAFAMSRSFPGFESARFVRVERIEGPIFNPPLTAGALVLENGARLSPFLDARWVGTPETIFAYARLRQATEQDIKAIWEQIDRSRRFEAVLLDSEKMPALLRHLSLQNPDWATVHLDSQAAVLCRRGGKNQEAIERLSGSVAGSHAQPDPAREKALAESVVRFLGSGKPSLLARLEFPYEAFRRAEYAVLLDQRPDAQEAYLSLLREQGGSLWASPNLQRILSDLFWCLQNADQPRAILALIGFFESRGNLNPEQARALNSHKARAQERLRALDGKQGGTP